MMRALGALVLAGFLVTAFTPLASWLTRAAVGDVTLQPVDAIVVLSSDVDVDGTLSSGSLQRAVHGVLLYKQGFAPLLVFSGTRRPEGVSEAEVRARMARAFGVPSGAILTESGVQNTRDEARRIHALLAPHGTRRIVLVSEALHLMRARRLFEHAGFTVFAAPSDGRPDRPLDPEKRVVAMRYLLRELAARLYARVS